MSLARVGGRPGSVACCGESDRGKQGYRSSFNHNEDSNHSEDKLLWSKSGVLSNSVV
jgi:hypothetical protein